MSWRSVLGVTAVCIIWGLGFALMKVGLRYVPPLLYVGGRFALTAACLFPLMRIAGLEWRVPREGRPLQAVIGALLFVQQAAIFWGLTYTTAGRVGLLLNTQPIMTAVLAHWFVAHDRLSWGKIAGLLLAAAGVLLVFRESFNGREATTRVGDMLALFAALSWGVQTVVTKHAVKVVQPAAVTAWSVTIASGLLLVGSLAVERGPVLRQPLDLVFVGASAYIVLVASVFGFVLWNYLIERNNPSQVTSFCFITPVASIFFGWLVLGEPLTADIVLATVLVGVGIFTANYRGNGSESTGRSS